MSEKTEETNGKIIQCPLTDNYIRHCPIYSCMWSNKDGGCFYEDNMEVHEYASIKGIEKDRVQHEIRSGRAAIMRMIVLNKYIEYVKTEIYNDESINELRHKANKSNSLKQLLITSKLHRILQIDFRLDNLTMALLCEKERYSKFCATLGGMTPPTLVSLLGLRETYQTDILSKISKLKTRKSKTKSRRGTKNAKARNNRTARRRK